MSQSPVPAVPPAVVPQVSRHLVLNKLVDLYEESRYLEIGVSKGVTFHKILAASKVAVDPEFVFDVGQAQRDHPEASYHSLTSDAYFGSVAAEEMFDVIYLDGLHTFDQTLRDLTNALVHLQPKGVIVVDDVRPESYHASMSDHRESVRVRRFVGDQSHSWMGDVYRLLWFIDTFYPSLTYRTIDNNHGQAVIWRQRRATVVERTVRQVADLTFGEMVLDNRTQREMRYGDILREVRQFIRSS